MQESHLATCFLCGNFEQTHSFGKVCTNISRENKRSDKIKLSIFPTPSQTKGDSLNSGEEASSIAS